jgi:hypothetical protein
MAAAPRWKVYDAAGNYQAACKEIEAAASLMGLYGEGATIRANHAKSWTVWEEPPFDPDADYSYDHIAACAYGRLEELQNAHREKIAKRYGLGGATR